MFSKLSVSVIDCFKFEPNESKSNLFRSKEESFYNKEHVEYQVES